MDRSVGSADTLSVGQAAARLGVAAGTLRSWERRYGLAPSRRSAGRHRRYTDQDMTVLDSMHRLTLTGEPPARAAWLALREAGHVPAERTPDRPSPSSGPGGRVLAVPGAGPRARGLARAASRLDVDAATRIIEDALEEAGVEATYDSLIRPVLAATGENWARTGDGIEVEHLFSEAAVEALRHHRRSLRPRMDAAPPVLLACAPRDQHVIPLHVLAAGLAERSVPVRILGPRVPAAALAAAVTRSGARSVFVWAQVRATHLLDVLVSIPARRPQVDVVVGGPGWTSVRLPAGSLTAASLSEAVELLS